MFEFDCFPLAFTDLDYSSAFQLGVWFRGGGGIGEESVICGDEQGIELLEPLSYAVGVSDILNSMIDWGGSQVARSYSLCQGRHVERSDQPIDAEGIVRSSSSFFRPVHCRLEHL